MKIGKTLAGILAAGAIIVYATNADIRDKAKTSLDNVVNYVDNGIDKLSGAEKENDNIKTLKNYVKIDEIIVKDRYTYWDLAKEFGPKGTGTEIDTREVVNYFKKLNDNKELRIGSYVKVPIYEEQTDK